MKNPKGPRDQRLDRIENTLDRLVERQVKHDESLSRIEVTLETSIHEHNLRFQKLLEMQANTWLALDALAAIQKDVAATQKELAEAQKATDEKLNILIDTVERFFRHRNGKND